MNNVIVREKPSKSVGLSVMSIGMVLCSIFCIYIGIIEGDMFYSVTGIVGTLFFGYCMLYIIKRTIRSLKHNEEDYLFKLDKTGITDKSSMYASGLIEWQEIKSAYVKRFMFQTFVAIDLLDEAAFYEKRNKKVSVIQKLNRKINVGPITMSTQTASMKTQELADLINERLKA